MFCRQQVAELTEQSSAFKGRNARLVVIGSGEVEHLPGFRRVTGYAGELFTDPSRESYRLLGFHSGVSGLMGLKSLSKGFTALRSGYVPGMIQGSVLQLGGAAVISPGGVLRYHYIGQEAGDYPPVPLLLKAV